MNSNIEKQLALQPKTWIRVVASLIVLTILVIPSIMQLGMPEINEKSFVVIQDIFDGFFNPDLDLMFDFTKKGLAYMLLETAAIAFLGTIIGAVIALPLAFLSSRNMTGKIMGEIGGFIITVFRTFPVFVYAIMFIRVVGLGPFAGVLTISVSSIGMLSKLFVESIEDMDRGIVESVEAIGLTNYQKFKYSIFPQLKTNFISIIIYRYDINIKNASILGIVGAGGIGAPIQFALGSNNWDAIGAILIGLIILVLLIDWISTRIRKKLA